MNGVVRSVWGSMNELEFGPIPTCESGIADLVGWNNLFACSSLRLLHGNLLLEIDRLGSACADLGVGSRPTRIMRPDRETPLPAADKVCMVVGDAEVVNRHLVTGSTRAVQDNPAAVVAAETIALHQILGARPTPALHPEGMFVGR